MTDAFFSVRELVLLLAPAVGEERSQELVHGALASLTITVDPLPVHDAIRALELLSKTPGVIGSATRFALARLTLLEAGALTGRRLLVSRHSRQPPPPAPVLDGGLSAAALVALLAPTVGQERSEEVVHEAVRRLEMSPAKLSLEEGLTVLEALASTEGLVGVAFRFAKARLIMHTTRT